MASKKQLQVAEIIKRNMSTVFMQEGGYIYGHEALVTVTNVLMSPDLGLAKIYLSIYNVKDKNLILDNIDSSLIKLKQSLAKRIKNKTRRTPDIRFFIDDTLDEMYKVNRLLDDNN